MNSTTQHPTLPPIQASKTPSDSFTALRIPLADGELAYWTVLDVNLLRVHIVDDFLFSVVRSGRAENTCRAYAHDIAGYLRWASLRSRQWMDTRGIDDYQASLLVDRSRLGKPRASTSINRRLVAVRNLLRFCIESGHLPSAAMGALYGIADSRFLPGTWA